MIHGIIMSVIVGYGLGSIPFGLVLSKLAGYGDIRKIGSGNIGATNVLRTGNKPLAAATLVLDSGKGAIAILILYLSFYAMQGRSLDTENAVLYGLIGGGAAVAGHCFPVWLKFKGGKGVATTIGTLLGATPWTAFVAICTWAIVAGFFRYSSLAALCAVTIAPIAALLIYGPLPALITSLISALVVFRHKDNIQRLTKGTEPKIGAKKEPKKER